MYGSFAASEIAYCLIPTFEFEHTLRPLKKYVLHSMNVGIMNEIQM